MQQEAPLGERDEHPHDAGAQGACHSVSFPGLC